MQVKASLNNLRMASRKVRLATNFVKGMDVLGAKAQLQYLPKKAAAIILKLINSGVANAKHNFNIEENNLRILNLVVEGGPSLKRWMPRAMGRATPILKRTCSISLVLEEKEPGQAKVVKKKKVGKTEPEKPAFSASGADTAGKEETISAMPEVNLQKQKPSYVGKPYGAQEQGKKKFFSRQSFGNLKKVFRRKSI